eukprot:3140584-Rhodomonas_salina.2
MLVPPEQRLCTAVGTVTDTARPHARTAIRVAPYLGQLLAQPGSAESRTSVPDIVWRGRSTKSDGKKKEMVQTGPRQKHPLFWYKLYEKEGFMDLISPRAFQAGRYPQRGGKGTV